MAIEQLIVHNSSGAAFLGTVQAVIQEPLPAAPLLDLRLYSEPTKTVELRQPILLTAGETEYAISLQRADIKNVLVLDNGVWRPETNWTITNGKLRFQAPTTAPTLVQVYNSLQARLFPGITELTVPVWVHTESEDYDYSDIKLSGLDLYTQLAGALQFGLTATGQFSDTITIQSSSIVYVKIPRSINVCQGINITATVYRKG